jgi:hypothetical protein
LLAALLCVTFVPAAAQTAGQAPIAEPALTTTAGE